MHALRILAAAAAAAVFVSLGVAQTPGVGYVSMTASRVSDATGGLLASGTISFAPVDNNGNPISFKVGGPGGQVISQPVTTLVTHGAYSLLLADTMLTSPANVCFSVQIVDNVTGYNLLGPGYECVQPAGSGLAVTGSHAWCTAASGSVGGACNWDNYIPQLEDQIVTQAGPTGPMGPPGPTGATGAPGGSLSYPGVASDGASGLNITGQSMSTTTLSSVNSQVNVMAPPYNAKGDCVTDDHDAIVAAQNAASIGGHPSALYFPNPPGGCYKSSTLPWRGISQEGQVSSIQSNAQLISMPGQDLWSLPDPADNMSTTATVTGGSNVIAVASATTIDPAQLVTGTGIPANTFVTSLSGLNVTLSAKATASGSGVSVSFTSATVVSKQPKIHHLMWTVDDSVDASASHPHRHLGRSTTDGVTNSTTLVTSAKIACTAGDVGQQMRLTYPDATTQTATMSSCTNGTTFTITGSTPLASTTATITPLSNVITVASATGIAVGQVALVNGFSMGAVITVTAVSGTNVTLSDYSLCWTICYQSVVAKFYDSTFVASESQSGVGLYLSIANAPVTQTVGNAAVAFDNRNASTVGSNAQALNFAHFEDLLVTALHNQQNNSAGFFLQGTIGSNYGTHWESMKITNTVYGLLEAMPYDTNPTSGALGGDQQLWNHIIINAIYPMVVYDGSFERLSAMQTAGANGPQFLGASETSSDSPPDAWNISLPEMELQTGMGLRLEGAQHTLTGSQIGDNGVPTFWDASDSRCVGCINRTGVVIVGGATNDIDIRGNINTLTLIDNPAAGNQIHGQRLSLGAQPKRPVAASNGRQSYAGAVTADFVNGSVATPYLNREDLFLWPTDLTITNNPAPIYDATAVPTGHYKIIPGNNNSIQGWTGISNGGSTQQFTVGGLRPYYAAKPFLISIEYNCPSLLSFTVFAKMVHADGSLDANLPTQSVTCSPAWNVYTWTADFTAYSGDHVQYFFNYSADPNNIRIGFLAARPFQDSYNGFQPQPTTTAAKTSGHCVQFDANGNTVDSGAACAGGSIASVQITTNTTAIPANTCQRPSDNTAAYQATTMTGVTTTSVIVSPTPTTATAAITGWGTTPGLSFDYYVSANTFNWCVKNSTGASITPGGSITWNVGAR